MNINRGEIIAIDKPLGMTSFGALARVRGALSRWMGQRKVKVGHAGTLDPLATGVLLLCTGRATKQIEQLQLHDKEYEATVKLGATTPSHDLEHEPDQFFPTEHITREMIEATLQRFVGDIEQRPPSFSACKVNGERAYKLKRKGEEVELKAKTIHIERIDLIDFDAQQMTLQLRIECGKGTYIRALARDLGEALQSGAHLTALRRTRVGRYKASEAIPLDHFDEWIKQQTLENDEQ